MKSTFTTSTNAEFYDVLKEDAETDGETNWTVSRHTRRGDRILLYVCAPVSSIVAVGEASEDAYLDDDPQSEWFGRYFADIHGLQMLSREIARAELLERFPAWGYWKQPRNCVRVPDAYAGQLNELIESARSAPVPATDGKASDARARVSAPAAATERHGALS